MLPKITVTRGTDFTIPLTFKQSNGSALNLTGCTVYMTAKKKSDNDNLDASAAFRKDVSIHTNAVGGLTEVAGVPADTVNASPGDYIYDLEVVDTAGRVTSFGQGKFTLEGEITRRA